MTLIARSKLGDQSTGHARSLKGEYLIKVQGMQREQLELEQKEIEERMEQEKQEKDEGEKVKMEAKRESEGCEKVGNRKEANGMGSDAMKDGQAEGAAKRKDHNKVEADEGSGKGNVKRTGGTAQTS